ncbi:MAG: translocation/assembly module TamB domain-containing protein [Kofleriaceae bacterium]
MSPRSRKVFRWGSRIFLGLIALLVLAIGGVVIFLHTDRGREIVREQVAAKLNDTFVGGASVGTIEGSPFGQLVLTDLVINDPEGQPAITVKRLAVEIALLPLVRQEARLKSVIASDVDVNLRRDENGELMIGRMVKPAPKSGWSVDLSHLEVHRGHVRVAMPDGPVNLDGIEIFGSASLPATGAIATSLGLRAVWREKRAPILLDAIARVNEGVVTVQALNTIVGGVRVTADDVRFVPGEGEEPPHLDGSLTIDAPKREVAKLVPGVKLPADVSATIVIRDDLPFAHVRVLGRLGGTYGQLLAGVDLASRRVAGTVTTNAVDLPLLTQGEMTGTGGALVAFDASVDRENQNPVANGVVTAWGKVNDLPRLASTIAFTTDLERAAARIGVRGPSLLALVDADVRMKGDAIVLERSNVIASTSNPAAASGGKAPVRGAIDVRLAASGRLSPSPDLAVNGTVKGKRLRVQDMSVSSLDLAVEAKGLPREPRGKAEVVLEDLTRGDMELGQLKLTAANQADGTIAVALRSRPKFAEWLIDLDALVTPPEKPREQKWTIDLVRHRVRAGDKGEWTGTTGHLELAPGSYAIENFSSTSRKEGSFTLSASARAHHVDLDLFVQKARLGNARIAADIDAPADFTNPVAWKRLPRSAIRSGTFELRGLDLAKVAELLGTPGEMSGRIDGNIELTPTSTNGKIALTDIVTPGTAKLGRLDAGLQVRSQGDEITPTLIGNFAALGRFQATARVALPERPFDPLAWKAVGLPAVRGANVAVDEILIEPGLLDRFGITTELRGRVKFAADISEGARSASVRLDVAQLRGDMIAQPINASVKATLDERNGSASVLVTSGKTRLLDVKGELPITIDQVFANPALLRTTRFEVHGAIPDAPAPTILAIFGRTEVTGGTLGGTIDASGTLGNPSVTAKLVGTNLQVPPGRRNRPVKVLEKVTVDASYIGGIAKARIQGTQKRGYLDMVAVVDPKNLDTGRVTIKAKAFDLQPLLVFAPGPAGAAKGRLDADLTVTGLDPVKARLAGKLHLKNARVPIAPQVGTLRRANVDVVIGQSSMTIDVDGRLGPGTVKMTSKIALDGAQPTSGEANITLRNVSPIGAVEPDIDADVKAKLRRESDRWVADIVVNNGVVKIPESRGEALKPVGAPSDMIYASGEKLTRRPMTKAPPKKATLVANITLNATHIESAEVRGLIKGKVSISADAESLGITGTIEAYRGDLDLFGRRYQVERAAVVFDGTTDPRLDLRIVHDFPEVTTITQVRGRLSKPELVMSSDPGIYSQSQLLGFLLGGEPNGDPQQGSAREVATNAGASFIANKLGGYVKKALPVDIDVVRYEAATASESAAVTVGTWLTRSLFLAYRRRLDARPDENANEAQAEYWLSRRVMLEASTGDRAVSGLDLLWRKRY